MLSYRHAYHAGNHADVLKHLVLTAVLRYMNRKEKPYRYIDTHAGAGAYALDTEHALKKAEFRDGIARILGLENLPEALAAYVELVREFDRREGVLGKTLSVYPGSPALANALRRGRDEMCLAELHPTDHPALAAMFSGVPGVEVRRGDGYDLLLRRLPPPSRRAVVHIDPSYEGGSDYARVVEAVSAAHRLFAESVTLVWYPVILNKPDSEKLPERLKELGEQAPKGWLHVRLDVGAPDEKGFGMIGSGMFLLNPPFTLHAELTACLPVLERSLAQIAPVRTLLEHKAV